MRHYAGVGDEQTACGFMMWELPELGDTFTDDVVAVTCPDCAEDERVLDALRAINGPENDDWLIPEAYWGGPSRNDLPIRGPQ